MSGMTEEDLSARVARAFPISLEERTGKAGAEHISELERLVNEDKIGDAILYLRVNEQNIGQDLVATLDTYLLRQLTAPLNMDSSRAAAFRSDLDTKILPLLEFTNYNKKGIRISGSAITGKSSKTGKLFSSESDIDLGVIVSNAQFDDLVASIESKLFEGKNIESYRASREYKEFLKDVDFNLWAVIIGRASSLIVGVSLTEINYPLNWYIYQLVGTLALIYGLEPKKSSRNRWRILYWIAPRRQVAYARCAQPPHRR